MLDIALRDLVEARPGVRITQLTLKHTVPATRVEVLEAKGLGELLKTPIVALPANLVEDATYVSVRVRSKDETEEWSLTWENVPSMNVPPTLTRLSESVGGIQGLSEKMAGLWASHTEGRNILHAQYELKGWTSPLLRMRKRKVADATLTPTGTLWTVRGLPSLLALTISVDPFDQSGGLLALAIGNSVSNGVVHVAELENRLWLDLSSLVNRR